MMADEEKCVQLKRSDSYGFGFSILGGSGSEFPPIIYDIIENSPAAVSGELEAGDVILEVNEKEVYTLTTKEVLKCLRLSSDLVTLKLKRDPTIKDRVRRFLSASNDMDTLKQAIAKEGLDGIREVIVRKNSFPAAGAGDAPLAKIETNGMHDKELTESNSSDTNGSGGGENNANNAKLEKLEQIRTPPRFETFMMTGDLILNLNAKASTGAATIVPKAKRVDCLTFGQSSTPASPDESEARGRNKGTKRESPSFCSPVADKKAAFGYTGSFVRTSRSEDHLQKDYLTAVNIDIDDDITSSLNTLLDTRQENPANDRIVWTYNAPIPQDSVSSSSPHSSSPSSPLQSPSYRPLGSPSPTKSCSPTKRRAPQPPSSSSSPSPSPSPTSKTAPVQFGDGAGRSRLGSDDYPSAEPVSPTSSDRSRGTDLETDDSREGSPRRPLPSQNGILEKKSSFEEKDLATRFARKGVLTSYGDGSGSCSDSKHSPESQANQNGMMASEIAHDCKIKDRKGAVKDGDKNEGGGRGQNHSNEVYRGDDRGSSRIESPRKSGSPPPDDDSDIESLHSFHYSPKAVDMPSACRLAKRLYYLEGFKKSDVSRHLSKNNEFSRVVAEEYLKFFEFTGDMLDLALRKFLRQFCLTGETQERERVLVHFSKRYLDCNPGSFNSQDAVHTLTCALMLLNTDLHGQNIGRKMTCAEYIDNLAELNDGENFPKDVIKALYHSIKAQPLEWAVDDEEPDEQVGSQEAQRRAEENQSIGHNPFLEMPNASTATEYKKGYVMRKCCIEPNGKRTPLGKRGWKMFYATLKDLVLYLHKDEHGFKKNQLYDNLHNSIRIHHALATKATDYTKKQHVFRLQTSEWAEYLFQTSDSKELQSWIDTINFVAASLSAPPLAGACGSQRKFQRPLLPCTHTKLHLRDQAHDHELRILQLEQELEDHRSRPPERGAKSRHLQEYQEKEMYLHYELKRYRTYSFLLRSKMAQHPELEPSLVETFIGEVDERDGDGSGGEIYEQIISMVSEHNPDAPIGTRSISDRSVENHNGHRPSKSTGPAKRIVPYTVESQVYWKPVFKKEMKKCSKVANRSASFS